MRRRASDTLMVSTTSSRFLFSSSRDALLASLFFFKISICSWAIVYFCTISRCFFNSWILRCIYPINSHQTNCTYLLLLLHWKTAIFNTFLQFLNTAVEVFNLALLTLGTAFDGLVDLLIKKFIFTLLINISKTTLYSQCSNSLLQLVTACFQSSNYRFINGKWLGRHVQPTSPVRQYFAKQMIYFIVNKIYVLIK